MIPRSTIKPLELVISAIHSLKERTGSSPQDILHYLTEKYDSDEETLKSHVQTGLKRGLSVGLLIRNGGLFRLNDVLSNPSNILPIAPKKHSRIKISKTNKILRKRKLNKFIIGRGKRSLVRSYYAQKGKKKLRVKDKKKGKRKRANYNMAERSRRMNDIRRRKKKQVKGKHSKYQRSKIEKAKPVKSDNESKPNQGNGPNNPEEPHGCAGTKEPEPLKVMVKA